MEKFPVPHAQELLECDKLLMLLILQWIGCFSALSIQSRHLSTQGVFGNYRKCANKHAVVQPIKPSFLICLHFTKGSFSLVRFSLLFLFRPHDPKFNSQLLREPDRTQQGRSNVVCRLLQVVNLPLAK